MSVENVISHSTASDSDRSLANVDTWIFFIVDMRNGRITRTSSCRFARRTAAICNGNPDGRRVLHIIALHAPPTYSLTWRMARIGYTYVASPCWLSNPGESGHSYWRSDEFRWDTHCASRRGFHLLRWTGINEIDVTTMFSVGETGRKKERDRSRKKRTTYVDAIKRNSTAIPRA